MVRENVHVDLSASTKRFEKAIEKSEVTVLKLSKALKDLRGTFLMLGLGMLFFGMQMKRTFDTILRTTVSTYNRILQENDFMGAATQRLAVHWEYLKFVIGSVISRALEPLMPRIIAIISAVTTWINENPKLTAGILGIGAALGGLLFTAGVILTPLSSMAGSLGLLGVRFPMISTAITKVVATIRTFGATVSIIAAVVTAILIGLYISWKENFSKIHDWVMIIWDGIKQFVKGLSDIFGGLITIIMGIIEGDFPKVLEGVKQLLSGIWNRLVGSLKTAYAAVVTVGIAVFRVIYGIIKTLWGGIIWLIDKIKDAIDWFKRLIGWGDKSGGRGYATGGVIPGTAGSAQTVMAHGGERILPREQSMSFNGGINITINTTGNVNASALADTLMSEIKRRAHIGGL